MTSQKAKNIEDILPSGVWKERRCFILAGGPSLEHFDFSVLKNELVMGINKAFLKYPCTANYSMDKKFYGYVTGAVKHPDLVGLPQSWNEYSGIKVFLATPNTMRLYRDVCVVMKSSINVVSFDLNVGIYPGSNSGLGAIMLAIALGANPIYLLGYDMKVSKGKTHWHEGYPNQSPDEKYDRKLKRYIRRFDDCAAQIVEAGISVVNLNPDSDLRCFPFDTVDNIMNEKLVEC